jgi:hypothetical protein
LRADDVLMAYPEGAFVGRLSLCLRSVPGVVGLRLLAFPRVAQGKCPF